MSPAREGAHTRRYTYKKGKTRYRLFEGSDSETPTSPKRTKSDFEMRQKIIKALEEDIEAFKKHMSYKQKRLDRGIICAKSSAR